MSQISRQEYSGMYGPTTGDQIRLGDTDLYIEIEKDLRVLGDEVMYGGGKTLRDGMGVHNQYTNAEGGLDLVITNVTVLDATLGVVKADVGVKDGKIAGIGKAGNPNVMDGVTPELITGPGTEAISGEHLILTAGGIDAHVHLVTPFQAQAALSNGVTTLWGGGTGPTDSTNGVTITPGPWNIQAMMRAFENIPINIGLMAKGNSTGRAPLVEQIMAGAPSFKIHEDWGAPPAVIRACLDVADEFDVQVSIHTDTLNESGYLEDTIAAFEGRTIHTFHTEGAGGGHAPDVIKIAAQMNVLPSSTTPTVPYGINSQSELYDMIMVCHNFNPQVPSDVAFVESRIRTETIAAEDVLLDEGVISMMQSDSQAMGRVGETWLRTIQLAGQMKTVRGKLAEDSSANDNFRVLRYVAKMTINPAITQGISHVLGSVTPGKMADLVLWEPAFFGTKPKMVLKGGMIAWSIMGDPNASLPTPQPVYYRPNFAAYGSQIAKTCVTFVSRAAHEAGVAEQLGLQRQVMPVYRTRGLTKRDMVRNDRTPKLEVDPETFAVKMDGVHATVPAARNLPLSQLYFFS
ncbi:urease subunit alpha [Micromonospora peucetia]|uniref:Urease subunit alpha n=1 Tax=Micromonospora peucetia TaxID=47871 RepID=A0A1C6W3K1_9ACTN|nr:urease subunit alpha [Micromonospora peucetia]MCX4390461.1 urease subunit alpha [Micromonospora peucetia]WSA32243.1 urease subunit alpha [Micromonospora peucetia]SCL73101.1 urease subunit alpha [Micromonospora peucetia]